MYSENYKMLLKETEEGTCHWLANLCPILCKPTDCSMPRSPVLHCLPEFAQIHVHWVGDANYLIFCCPLLLLPSIFPSIRIQDERFNFNISHFIEYSELISFRIDCFDLLAVQRTLKSLLQHHTLKHQFFSAQPPLWSNSHICAWLLEKSQLWLYLCFWFLICYLFFQGAYFNFMVAVTIHGDFGAQENKIYHFFYFSPIVFATKWWDQMSWS